MDLQISVDFLDCVKLDQKIYYIVNAKTNLANLNNN